MLSNDLLLAKNDKCIQVRTDGKWVLFNMNNQAAVLADDQTVSIVSMLETPKYYGELEVECLNSYSNLNSDGFSQSINHLIDSGIIYADNGMETESAELRFESHPELPSIIAVHVTNRCNLNCKYCYNIGFRSNIQIRERNKSEWMQLLLSMQEKGINRFDITGGEPLLRKDLFPVYEELKKRGAQVELITNGILIDNLETAKSIANCFSRVSVSLDSCNTEEHELYRGSGTHSRVVNALKLLTEANVYWQAKAVLHEGNCSSMKQTREFIDALGGHGFDVSIMVGTTRNQNSIITQYYKTVVQERVDKGDINLYSNPNFDFNTKYGAPCPAARSECAIDPYGNTFPCRVFMQEEMCCGNVFDTDISQIWKESDILQSIRSIDYKKIHNCGHCSFLRICLGGCRALAYMNSGSLLSGLDPFDCSLRKRRINNIIIRHAIKSQENRTDAIVETKSCAKESNVSKS